MFEINYLPKAYFQETKRNVIIKAYTIQTENCVLTLVPIKGKYGVKNDYITIIKNGCMLFELMSQESGLDARSNVIDYEGKKNFAVAVDKVGNIIGVSDAQIEAGNVDVNIQYTIATGILTKNLRFTQSENDYFNVSLEYVSYSKNNGESKSDLQMTITKQDFVVIRDLFTFSLPYLLGWQALTSYEFAERDSRDDRL